MPPTEAMPTSLLLLRAAIQHLTAKDQQEEHISYLTSLQVLHDAPQPHLLAR